MIMASQYYKLNPFQFHSECFQYRVDAITGCKSTTSPSVIFCKNAWQESGAFYSALKKANL